MILDVRRRLWAHSGYPSSVRHNISQTNTVDLLGCIPRLSNRSACWIFPGAVGITGTEILLLKRAVSHHHVSDRVITHDPIGCSKALPHHKVIILQTLGAILSQKDTLGLQLGSIPWLSNGSGCWIFLGGGDITRAEKMSLLKLALPPHLLSDWVVVYDYTTCCKAVPGLRLVIL